MTKQEILALIDAKIAGQGTNIDAGSALPEILSGILGLIPDTKDFEVITVSSFPNVENATITEICPAMGISEEQFLKLFDPGKQIVLFGPGSSVNEAALTKTFCGYNESPENPEEFSGHVLFGTIGEICGEMFEIVVRGISDIDCKHSD